MIEDLKQVRDALEALKQLMRCFNWHNGYDNEDKQRFHDIVKSTLDRIIADHIPDASKMVVPEGYALVPIEPTPAPTEKVDVEALKRVQSYSLDEEPHKHGFVKGYNSAIDHLAANYDFVPKEQK